MASWVPAMPCQVRYIGFSHVWVTGVNARGVRIGSPGGFVERACTTVRGMVTDEADVPAQQEEP